MKRLFAITALFSIMLVSSAEARVRVESTAYCLTGTMADGTYTRDRSVANNFYPLGTKLTIRPGFRGKIWFVVRDRIGWGSQLDFWSPSCYSARQYGRRMQTIQKGWTHKK